MIFRLATLTLALLPLWAHAETFFVAPVEGTGVAKETTEAVTELIKTAVAENTKNKLADEKTASFQLRGKLLKLGESYILTLAKTQAGNVIYSSQLKAEEEEELDKIAYRLVRAVSDENAAKHNAQVDDVTNIEADRNTKKKRAQKNWYFGLGPSFLSNLNTNGSGFNFNIAFSWDVSDAAVKLFWDGVSGPSGSNASFSDMGIGVTYFFSPASTTPILEAGLSYGSARVSDSNGIAPQSISNFVIEGGAGLQFFRTSNVNLELLVRYKTILQSTSQGTPSGFGFRLGLYF